MALRILYKLSENNKFILPMFLLSSIILPAIMIEAGILLADRTSLADKLILSFPTCLIVLDATMESIGVVVHPSFRSMVYSILTKTYAHKAFAVMGLLSRFKLLLALSWLVISVKPLINVLLSSYDMRCRVLLVMALVSLQFFLVHVFYAPEKYQRFEL